MMYVVVIRKSNNSVSPYKLKLSSVSSFVQMNEKRALPLSADESF